MTAMRSAPRARVRPKRVLAPWRDRQGRLSPLKATVLACAFLPAIVLSYWWATGQFGARPLTEAIHGCGLWAFRFLLISLAVSPARVVFDAPKVLLVRRMLGLTALAYALAHFGFYIADEHFVLLTVVHEILRRFYLTIGFVVLVGLAALGATSTDAALRWMGRGWKRLHRTAYALGLLAAFHYFLQTKANVTEAVMFAGFLIWLLLWRLLPKPLAAQSAGVFRVGGGCAARHGVGRVRLVRLGDPDQSLAADGGQRDDLLRPATGALGSADGTRAGAAGNGAARKRAAAAARAGHRAARLIATPSR